MATPAATREADPIQLAATLRRAFREAQLSMTQALARCGLSEQRYHMLLELGAAGDLGLVQGGLAEDLRCPETRISLLVRELSESGLVSTTRAAPDRRQVRVRLTAEGRRVLMQALHVQRESLARLAETIEPETIADMLRLALETYLGVETEVRLKR